ncbi:MAG: hypothetical protein R6T90_08045 [Dissulfuribacterales bacterium]
METGNKSQTAPPSFGIENTMEVGAGSTELLKDLLGPDTSTSDPDSVEPIEEEPKEESKEEGKKGETKKGDTGEESKDDKNPISTFFESDEDEEPKGDEPKTKEKVETKEDVEEKEEEEKEKEEEGEEEKEGVEGEEGDDSSKFSALSKDLYKLGVFTPDEEGEEQEVKTPEEFLEKFNAEKKKGAMGIVNNFIGQFGEDYQQAFDAIFVKGVSPKQYFSAYNEIEDFGNLDLEEEGNQEIVMKKALSDQGLDPEDIDTEVERLKNYGDLKAVADKYHKVIVKKQANKLKEMESQAQEEQQRKAAFKNQYIQNVQSVLQEKLKEKEFDGIPINPRLAQELQDYLLVDKYKTASGETLTDFDRTILELKKPENHATKVKVGLLLKILEKDPNLSTIQKSGVTKKSNELFGEVARQVTKTKKKDDRQQTNKVNKWFL